MSYETWEKLQSSPSGNIDRELAMQCAPLITGLKASNLLTIPWSEYESMLEVLRGSKILSFFLGETENRGVFFLYRMDKMEKLLQDEEVAAFLQERGYDELTLNNVLTSFRMRYLAYREGKAEFPHEMGILLEYPVEDVEGFIRYGGRNYLCSGYWKVYKDRESKQELFRKFEYARENLIQLLSFQVGMKDILAICQ